MRVSIFASVASLFAAFLILLFVNFYGSDRVVVMPPHSSSTSTVAVVKNHPLPVNALSPSATSTSTTTASQATSTQPKAPVKKPPAAQLPPPAPVAAAPEPPSGDINSAASQIRSALVNILCYARPGSGLSSISGSGVIITSSGIILTNAHIAQYFLLADRGVSCSIRTGSPAKDTYTANLIYISSDWIKANANLLTTSNPSGTGQYDYAFLGISGSQTGATLPSSFPFIPLERNAPVLNEPVVIASYGAQFLTSSEIQNSLAPTIVYGSVKKLYTFTANTTDVVSLGGSAAAQEGSSGGGAVDASGELTATITTSTIEGDTAARDLGAITASYIRGDYATATGFPLDLLLQEPTSIAITDYASVISGLEANLTAGLPK